MGNIVLFEGERSSGWGLLGWVSRQDLTDWTYLGEITRLPSLVLSFVTQELPFRSLPEMSSDPGDLT